MNMNKNKFCSAIIVASGTSSRMNGLDKVFTQIAGCPCILRSILAFENCSLINEIIVVIREQSLDKMEQLLKQNFISKIKAVVIGGKTRFESVQSGISKLSTQSTHCVIADGARPLTSTQLISRVLSDAFVYNAATASLPINETVKRKVGDFCECSLKREELVTVQTPQAFEVSTYKKAVAALVEKKIDYNNITDDSMVLELFGKKVFLSEGEHLNLKITTPKDITLANAILGSHSSHNTEKKYRVGHGYDVHALSKDRKLILGGVEIPSKLGLLGHSDADVLVHAIIDAIIGAQSLGDIGKIFPDSNDAYKDACSLDLLNKITDTTRENGYTIENVDATIVAQSPKLSPYISEMAVNIAECLKISPSEISIKTTTEEQLGFTGNNQGMKSHAVVLLSTQ